MATEKLLAIKEQIEEAKSKKSQIEGQIQTITGQMNEQFEVSTIEQAEEKLNQIGNELDTKEADFNKKMGELENAYNWD